MDRYLTPGEQQKLLVALKSAPADDWLARRDAAAILALLHSGCRIGEFLSVTVGDTFAALDGGYLFIPKENRKGREGRRRDHSVYATRALKQDLRALIAAREAITGSFYCRADAPLVVGRHGEPLSVRAFQLRIKACGKQAGLPAGFSAHWLRHTRGMNIMACSTASDPRGVAQRALGHASIASTGIYTGTPRAEVESTLDAIDASPVRVTRAQLRAAYERRAML